MLAFLDALSSLQALAVCGLGPAVGTLAASCLFFAYEATRFVRLAWRGR